MRINVIPWFNRQQSDSLLSAYISIAFDLIEDILKSLVHYDVSFIFDLKYFHDHLCFLLTV